MNTIGTIFFITLAIVLVILYYLSRRTFEKQVDKWLANPEKKRALLTPRRVTIAPQGCLAQFGAGGQAYTWESIYRVEMTDDYCFLILPRNIILAPIPRRAFHGEQDFRNFYESCRQFQEAAAQAPFSEDG